MASDGRQADFDGAAHPMEDMPFSRPTETGASPDALTPPGQRPLGGAFGSLGVGQTHADQELWAPGSTLAGWEMQTTPGAPQVPTLGTGTFFNLTTGPYLGLGMGTGAAQAAGVPPVPNAGTGLLVGQGAMSATPPPAAAQAGAETSRRRKADAGDADSQGADASSSKETSFRLNRRQRRKRSLDSDVDAMPAMENRIINIIGEAMEKQEARINKTIKEAISAGARSRSASHRSRSGARSTSRQAEGGARPTGRRADSGAQSKHDDQKRTRGPDQATTEHRPAAEMQTWTRRAKGCNP
jgi:hypothetical protein